MLKDRSFLVTGNLEKKWKHKLPGAKKMEYLDLDDLGLLDSDEDRGACILFFSNPGKLQEAAV